jgi:ring-1,2-phenylacetyl-CoA epoxidase subunit PaaC
VPGVSVDDVRLRYTLRLGDNALVLSQRLIELVASGPELEEELANANIALDYLGQARMFYSYAGELEGKGRDEDDFAFLRDAPEFENVLLVEQPNGHFGDTIVRQVLFDSFYGLQLDALCRCADEGLREIAARAIKEVRYHLRHASQWLIRLGDGTAESQRRVQDSLNRLWRYTGELFDGDDVDAGLRDMLDGPDLEAIRPAWRERIGVLCDEARLDVPADGWMAGGGRRGVHTESFGYLVAEMQHLPRSLPGAAW